MASKTAEDVARIVKVVPGALTKRPTHDVGPDAGSARGGVPADTLGVGIEALVAEERKELFVGQQRPGAEHARDGALPLQRPVPAGEGSSLRARGLGTEAALRRAVHGLVVAVSAGQGSCLRVHRREAVGARRAPDAQRTRRSVAARQLGEAAAPAGTARRGRVSPPESPALRAAGVLREADGAGAGDAGGGVAAAGPETRPGLGEADDADGGLV